MYFAHSAAPACGIWHALREHLIDVGELAARFAASFEAAQEARLAGLLHDLGKYGDLFQQRLRNPKITGVDHWTLGAWAAHLNYGEAAWAACMAAAGHHLGLTRFNESWLTTELDPYREQGSSWQLSDPDLGRLLSRLSADGVILPEPGRMKDGISSGLDYFPAADMADFRMLYSALVDADFLDTEAHFSRGPDGVKRLREEGPALDSGWALGILKNHIKGLATASTSAPAVNAMRADLLAACLEAAALPTGQFTLSAPTGAGKTLSMLAFALAHAKKHGLRRVVMVIPYLSIIEQTARVFHEVFEPHLPAGVDMGGYVLEHHSNAGVRGGRAAEDGESEAERRRRELSQNWDAPIIITTSVQMLESLFAHRPGPCRKLHRLAGSVILFDEVQTLPSSLAAATLAGLSRLCRRFRASVVFSTATQPAFRALGQKVESLGGESWRPREIAPPGLGLFKRVKRVEVAWPGEGERLSPAQVAGELAAAENRRSLCVVNLKRQARAILQELGAAGCEGLFHLSTSMCIRHREDVLQKVRRLLDDPGRPPVRLVSTQCVEAGVDIDFPVVYRAWGPLTSIAQAAGRCNRGGNLDLGRMRVFYLREESPETGRTMRPYPDEVYGQAASVASSILSALGPEGLDLDDPGIYERYYQALYKLAAVDAGQNELEEAVRACNFEDTAKHYRLIDRDAINVLVPYDRRAYEELARQARQGGLTGAWVRRARPHSVGVFRSKGDSDLLKVLEPIPLLGRAAGTMSEDWFICPEQGYYDAMMGLDEKATPSLLVT